MIYKMVVGLVNESFYKIINLLPPILSENVNWMFAILKALGILVIGYLIYLIIMLTINLRKIKQLSRIRNKVENLDQKVDLLLKKRGIKIPKALS